MTQEALKLALTALEINLTLLEKITPYKGQEDFLSDAIAITQDTTNFIKKTLAQPEQEPKPATVFDDIDDDIPDICCQQYDTCLRPCTPRGVHLAQRTWVGLTEDEISALWNEWKDAVCLDHKTWAKAIEAKLKQKNGYAEEKNT